MATIYNFKKLPQAGDQVIKTEVSVFNSNDKYYIDYWVQIGNTNIHMPIGDDDLDEKLIGKKINTGTYSMEEFIKLIE